MDRIYLRHGDKGYKNGQNSTFKHDPPLTLEGKEESRRKALELVEKYGLPKYIVASPYERTRATAEEMAAALPEPVEIRYDVLLSEYLGNHYHETLDVTSETRKYYPPHPEKIRDLKSRVRCHFYQSKKDFPEERGIVWYITHGLVITCLSELMGRKIKAFPPLSGIYLSASGSFFPLEEKSPSPPRKKSPSIDGFFLNN